MKIYTRTGDAGETALLGGPRVGKDDPRVWAYGDLDELGAVLGLVLAEDLADDLASLLAQVQRDLFAIGAHVADPSGRVAARQEKSLLDAALVRRLEEAIDAHQAGLPPLRSFVLPGGGRAGALLHLARTVCRRAERRLVALARVGPLDPLVLEYVNRLSDLLFVLARHENRRRGRSEATW